MVLSCPHCGLKLGMSGPRHEYCPRCLEDRRQPVPLVASSLFKLARSDGAAAPWRPRERRGVEVTGGRTAIGAA